MENLTVEEFNQMVQEWIGKPLMITKKEIGDLDQLIMHVHDISYTKNTRKIDDYVPTYTLRLTGEGNIQTDHGDQVPIPDDQYDIQLDNDTVYEYGGEAFHLKTNRGSYTMKIADPPVH